MDEDTIKKMKCKELIVELKKINKPTYGLKAVLVGRLLDYYHQDKVHDIQAIGKHIDNT